MKQTVYPARAGAFPAVSFRTLSDAMKYIFELSKLTTSGICVCPAESYFIHQRRKPETLR